MRHLLSRLAIVVTATGESKSINEISDAISTASTADIEHLSPTHPSELVNRYPGVHVNDLGGEGHMTAIRQPITTKGVYLFLEDGIPTRPTGCSLTIMHYMKSICPKPTELKSSRGLDLPFMEVILLVALSIQSLNLVRLKQKIIIHSTRHLDGIDGYCPLAAQINDDLGIRIDLNTTNNEGFRDSSNYRRLSTTSRLDGFINDYLNLKPYYP